MLILLLGHAVLSALVLVARVLEPEVRDKAVRAVCAVGAGLGIALFLTRRSSEVWRTTLIEPDSAALAGIAVAVAWVIAAVLLDEDDRWRAASLVGIAGSGLAVFAATQWVVPALLFWSVTSLAVAGLVAGLERRSEVWIAFVLSDLCFAAGIVGYVLDDGSWRLPSPAPGRAFWFLLAAVILRAGVIPRFGMWRALGTPAAAALPLLAGGALVLTAGPAGRAEPWAAVALLAVAIAQAAWGSVRKVLAPGDFAGWPTAVALALIYVAPGVAALVGAAALLAVGALALWPISSGRAQPERGLVLTLAPLTAGFGAVVFAATRAFEASTAIDISLDSVPWIAVSALIPLVMAAGALLGARVGREQVAPAPDIWPVVATWLIVAGTVVLGLVPGSLELPDDVVGTQRSFLILLLVALVAGGAAGWLWNLRHPDHRRSPAPEPVALAVGARTGREARALRGPGATLVERMLVLVALVLGVATLGAVGWLTYEGLSQGFL